MGIIRIYGVAGVALRGRLRWLRLRDNASIGRRAICQHSAISNVFLGRCSRISQRASEDPGLATNASRLAGVTAARPGSSPRLSRCVSSARSDRHATPEVVLPDGLARRREHHRRLLE
jgi:hypothetical protein